MSIRYSRRLLTAGMLVAGATTAAAGPAHAVATTAAVHAPAQHYGDGGNCNNDPNSEFATDPYLCPPNNNAEDHDGEYGYPDHDHGYGEHGHDHDHGGYRGHGYPGRH